MYIDYAVGLQAENLCGPSPYQPIIFAQIDVCINSITELVTSIMDELFITFCRQRDLTNKRKGNCTHASKHVLFIALGNKWGIMIGKC